jgi:sugar (pentulose or hexulose) kinase
LTRLTLQGFSTIKITDRLVISAHYAVTPEERLHQNRGTHPAQIGAAIVGGIGVGIFDGFDVAERFSHQVATMDPDRERHERYLGEYQLFLDAYRRLEPWFDKI